MDSFYLPDFETHIRNILQVKQLLLNLTPYQNEKQTNNTSTKTLQIVNSMLNLYQELNRFFDQQTIKRNFLTFNIPPIMAISKYETVQLPSIIGLAQQNTQHQLQQSKMLRTKSQQFLLSIRNTQKNKTPSFQHLSQKSKSYIQVSISQYAHVLQQSKYINNFHQFKNQSLLQIIQNQKHNEEKLSIKQSQLIEQNLTLSLLIKDMQRLLEHSVSLQQVSLMKNQINLYKTHSDQVEKRLQKIESQFQNMILENNNAQKVIEQLNDQINNLRDVNQQLSQLEENIQFNDSLHQQNLTILKENYRLSRKIYELELQIKSNKIKNNYLSKTSNNIRISSLSKTKQQTLISQNMIQSKWIDTSDDKSSDEASKIQLSTKIQKKSPFHRIKKITASLPPNCHKLNKLTLLKQQKRVRAFQFIKQQMKQQQKFVKLKDFIHKDGIQQSHILSLILKIINQSSEMIKTGILKTLSPSSILISQCISNSQQIEIVFETNNLSVSQLQELQMYESPETLINGTNNSESNLVWNIGTIIYYLMTKRSYFRQPTEVLIFKHVELEENMKEQVKDLIRYSLVRHSEARITIGQLKAGIHQEIHKLIYF